MGFLEEYTNDIAKLPKSLNAWFKGVCDLSDSERKRFVAEARDKLKSKYGGKLPPQADHVLKQIAGCDPSFIPEMTKQHKSITKNIVEAHQSEVDIAIAQMVFGLLGLFHSSFNVAYARACDEQHDLSWASRMTIAEKNSDFENDLRLRQRALFEAIAAKQSFNSLAVTAESMANMIELTILPFASLLGEEIGRASCRERV